jgi:hypothetical protein
MSITKHKIFKIDILQNMGLEIDDITSEKINTFLSVPNNIYINHSTCILTESIEKYGNIEQINRYVLISLIYEDLDGTAMDLNTASPIVKKTVKREIKADSKIPKPNIETNFDKTISNLESRENHSLIDNVEVSLIDTDFS